MWLPELNRVKHQLDIVYDAWQILQSCTLQEKKTQGHETQMEAELDWPAPAAVG